MEATTQYKIQLDTGSKKFVCPDCGKRSFVRMKNSETGDYLPDHVGRCDRENNCGYHFTLKQYFTEIGEGAGSIFGVHKKGETLAEEKIDFIPFELVEQSMAGYQFTNFAQYLIDLFGDNVGKKVLAKYKVGRSKNDNGKACIFWRIDKDEKARTGKIMCYDPETGKRNKEINPTWVHKAFDSFSFKLCFFGEHLLTADPDKKVGIVESEKTAIIASVFMPDMVWLATGGIVAASGGNGRYITY